jgi:hypothetical protein
MAFHIMTKYLSDLLNEVATGKLSLLENSVAIYKVRVDPDGNGAFLMWHWK